MSLLPDTVNFVVTPTGSDVVCPMKTYRMDFENKRILGNIDKQDTIMQFVKKVLSTDKYAYLIYDKYYGNEIMNLVGKPYDFICAEIPRIVQEALLTDDRIKEVKDFTFEKTSFNTMYITFVVVSIYSEEKTSLEVRI